MATRQQRLDAFPNEAERPPGQLYELLCEDHVGTYLIPFLCHWTGDAWQGVEKEQPIDARVVGWRRPRPRVPQARGGEGDGS
jgi:hypothetical protein